MRGGARLRRGLARPKRNPVTDGDATTLVLGPRSGDAGRAGPRRMVGPSGGEDERVEHGALVRGRRILEPAEPASQRDDVANHPDHGRLKPGRPRLPDDVAEPPDERFLWSAPHCTAHREELRVLRPVPCRAPHPADFAPSLMLTKANEDRKSTRLN